MTHSYPRTIDNGFGEQLTFLRVVSTDGGDRLEVEGRARSGVGPPMHVHLLQEEAVTVVEGRMGYQLAGDEPREAGPGETVACPRGVPHRWWNAGSTELRSTGWITPANNAEFFLTAMFDSVKRSTNGRPSLFDVAFLMTRYRSEFDMLEIPAIVKTIGFPLLLVLGRLLGKYRRFADAPVPVAATAG
jgi:mannose-6-phosphate isomerase-like protein (cupin superfamily)